MRSVAAQRVCDESLGSWNETRFAMTNRGRMVSAKAERRERDRQYATQAGFVTARLQSCKDAVQIAAVFICAGVDAKLLQVRGKFGD